MKLIDAPLDSLSQANLNLVSLIKNNAQDLDLLDSEIYFSFPLYKNLEDNTIISDITIISENYGVIIISCVDSSTYEDIKKSEFNASEVFSAIYAKLIRNQKLKQGIVNLKIPALGLIYAPNYGEDFASDFKFTRSTKGILDFFKDSQLSDPLPSEVMSETFATIEGSKALPKFDPRVSPDEASLKPKGRIADQIENQIALFDHEQKLAYMSIINGPERIRGLAGSGKTVVLAMKAALTHLRYPDAKIVYTFYTKSLYQHVRNMITRFYRQFDDKDPNWNNLMVMHAWGGEIPGLYSNLSEMVNRTPLTLSDAKRLAPSKMDPFSFICKDITPNLPENIFDYIFIDEGQDFGKEFIEMTLKITKGNKICWGYDELQTIFMPMAPTAKDVGIELTRDIVLKKCYRNPRDVLIVAHSIGFGIYGSRIVQMLESKEHWEDLGYEVVEGDFTEGSNTLIHRPTENSPSIIKDIVPKAEIVGVSNFTKFDDEIEAVSASISDDIAKGLRPKDILVITVDDKNARSYLSRIELSLLKKGIKSRNRHSRYFSTDNFFEDHHVTLTTVHKAKGNEAYMVYVVGCDAVYSSFIGARERNMLFTALTRTKGWVRASGIEPNARAFTAESQEALSHSPNMEFKYPGKTDLKVMRRDLLDADIHKSRKEQELRRLLNGMTKDEVRAFLDQEGISKD
ncbi:DEAD/DEAH box helicase [Deinococcus sp. 23YEL01]|uniref:DEAD/DEAH box helicase n=1 Tax=Deinococcus sp. 23YEL01 TaxID=2745871 RepID=UPI001E39EA0F|nr:ATP-binding domain-containing protein [Deinococcus sp. 23YEL01]MCD0169118.1 ATP-binding domain-containing protein [Deinococcus sp. 23YEL01]